MKRLWLERVEAEKAFGWEFLYVLAKTLMKLCRGERAGGVRCWLVWRASGFHGNVELEACSACHAWLEFRASMQADAATLAQSAAFSTNLSGP